MNDAIALDTPTGGEAGRGFSISAAWPRRIGLALAAAGLWQAAVYIREVQPYRPASGFGYLLGLIGGSLMALLLLYSVRKRFRSLAILGALKHWFKFHMLAGVLGPSCVILHSTFHVGSFNAAIALGSMLLVVASGLVGRFLYRKVHNGLYGSRANLKDIQSHLKQQMEALSELLARHPQIGEEVARFMGLLERKPGSRLAAIREFVVLGIRRRQAGARIQKIIRHIAVNSHGTLHSVDRNELQRLAATLDGALAEAQLGAQFYGYERLFSLWHAVHIPFLWMLLITSIAHVVAVHAY